MVIMYLLKWSISQTVLFLMLTADIFVAMNSCCNFTCLVVAVEMTANLDFPVLGSMITPDDFVVGAVLVVRFVASS